MTPCEKLGYKVGDRFEVVNSNGFFCTGEIVTLDIDDGSEAPRFSKGSERYFKHLDNVRLIDRVSGANSKNPIEYLKAAHADGDLIDPATMLRECYGITKTERVVVEWSEGKREIKVGDKVRIVGNKCAKDGFGHCFKAGDIVVITEIDLESEEQPYQGGGSNTGWLSPEDVELI